MRQALKCAFSVENFYLASWRFKIDFRLNLLFIKKGEEFKKKQNLSQDTLFSLKRWFPLEQASLHVFVDEQEVE